MTKEGRNSSLALISVEIPGEDEVFLRELEIILGDEAYNYLKKNNWPLDRIKLASQIVISAFREAWAGSQEELRERSKGNLKNAVKKLVRSGLRQKDERASQLNGVITELASGVADFSKYTGMTRRRCDDLCIPYEEVREASAELKGFKMRTVLPKAEGMAIMAESRQKIIGKLTLAAIISNYDRGNYFQKIHTDGKMEILDERVVADKLGSDGVARQALAVRGEVAALLIEMELNDHNADAFYYNQANISRLLKACGQIDLEKDGQKLARAIWGKLGKELEETESIPLIQGYINQIVRSVKNWNALVERQGIEVTDPAYWVRQKAYFAALLPLDPMDAIRRYVYEEDKLPQAIADGTPHLWQDGVRFGPMIVPAIERIRDIEFVGRILAARGDRTLLDKVAMALAAWNEYSQSLSSWPEELTELKQRRAVLVKEAGGNKEALSLLGVLLVKRELRTVANQLKGAEMILSRQKEISRLREHYGEPEAKDKPIVMVKAELKMLLEDVADIIKRVNKRTLSLLDRTRQPGWGEACYYVKGLRQPPVVDAKVAGDIRQRYLSMLEELGRNEHLALPTEIYDEKSGAGELIKYIEWWIQNLPASGDRVKREKTLRVFAQGLRSGHPVRELMRRSVAEDLKERVAILTLLEEAYGRRAYFAGLEKVLKETLRAPADRFYDLLKAVNEFVDETPDRVRALRIVPLETIGKDTKRLAAFVEEIQKLLAARTLAQKGYAFIIPERKDLAKTIKAEFARIRKRSGKYSRELTRSAQATIEFVQLFSGLVDNPLVPFDLARGLSSAVLIDVVRYRVRVAKAFLAYDGLKKQKAALEKQKVEFEKDEEKARKARELRVVERRIESLQKRIAGAEAVFINQMHQFGFLIPVNKFG
ncbi:hypothetical protein HY333_01680 [Candidatus Collierbacteria bacterium]|nr:hypothetical protein [Candidatus Collierbacteria bacterium]